MEKIQVPEGYQQVMPYLIVKGADKFKQFVQKVFHGVEKHMEMRDEKLIRHAEVQLGDSVIMFADATEQFEPGTMSLFIYVKNADETYQSAIDEGSKSIEAPADRSYGRTCGVQDPFGNTWWITSAV